MLHYARAVRRTLLFVSLAILAAWSPVAAQTCTTYADLTFATWQDAGGTQELKMELLVPQSASPVPVVVWIHGGGWFSGSRLPIPAGVSALCSRGYAVASVDYRLSDTALWPAQIQDVKGAVRWLRARASTYNLDPDRFAAWGTSAGAHLASMLGTAGDQGTFSLGNETVDLQGTTGGNLAYSSRVQAVVSWYGYGDFLQMGFYPSTQDHDSNGSAESRLVGDWIQRVPERVATASPLTFASADDPPFLVMHGTLDDLVPFNQSELLVDALRLHGVRVSWVPVPNGGHGNSAFNTAASYQTVYDYLAGVLLNVPPVTVGVQATDGSASEAGEAGAGTATFLVTRTGSTGANTGPLTVHWAPGGTARIGADYSLAAPWSITIPAGASGASLIVRPVDDPLVEGDETVVLKLASSSTYRIDDAAASAAAVLADNDGQPDLPVVTLSAPDPVASEIGPAGGAFTVAVEPPAVSDLAVRYTVSGTATNGEDYVALSGKVIVPAGAASAEIDLTVLTDGRLEPSETVILTLEPSSQYEVAATPSNTASVHIREADDEPALPVVSVSATDPYGSEPGADDGAFTVTRTGSTEGSLTLDLSVGGTARENVDYSNIPGTVFFGKGVSRISIILETRDDLLVEDTETATLRVVPAPALLAGPYAGSVVAIGDDEPSPGPGGFYLLPPCRLASTRGPAGAWGAPRMASGEIRVFEAAGRCGIPADATALALNLTVIDPASLGHATLFETGAPKPTVSSINFRAGQNKANNAIVPLTGTPRSLAVYCGAVAGGCDVILDVTGYFR